MPRRKKEGKGSLAKAYQGMTQKRQPYLDRGREYSKLTVPYVMPEDSEQSGNSIKHRYQSLGADCVNTFSNKFINTLFPIGTPFFSLEIDELALTAEEAAAYDKTKMKVLPMYLKVTLASMRNFSKMDFRSKLTQYAKHLLIVGNCTLQMLETSAKVIGLDKYVVKRSQSGLLIKGIIRESHDVVTLDKEVQEKLSDKEKEEESVIIYTCYNRTSATEFEILQETEDGSPLHKQESIKENNLGIIFGRLSSIDGEDYGRGYVEDYSSDLFAYDFLAEYKARGAATMLDVKYLVRPGASTDLKTLNASPPGTFVRGAKDDIIPLELAKYGDTALLKEIMDEYKTRLSRAFLIVSGTIRDSERTTKFEIEQNVLDLENARAGIYSSQATELQRPIAFYLLDQYNEKLTEDELLVPNIDTGLAAIGKQNDLNRLRMYSEIMSLPATWPEPTQKRLDLEKFDNFVASLVHLDTSLFFLDDEQNQQAEQSAAETVGSDILTDNISAGVGKAIGENIIKG